MKVDHILIAHGSAMQPRITQAIFTEREDWALEQCPSVIKVLAKVGYFSFDLYNVTGEDHVLVKSFRVEMPEPIVREI